MMRQADSQGSSADEQNEIEPKQCERGTSADGVQTSTLGASDQQEAEMEPSASHALLSTAGAKQLSPIAPFVSKTYGIVNDEPDDVVSWWKSNGEDTFVIKSVDVFQEQVLPRFFSHRNYSSFVRQLNNHGFSRVRSPSSAGDGGRGGRPEQEAQWWEFKHLRFRRGHKSLLSEIKRRKEKKRLPLGSAHSRVFIHQSSPAQSGDLVEGGQGERAVRWEMENLQEQMRDMSRKLDELKSLVVGLVVCVRESGIPMSVPQSSTQRSATEGAWGAGYRGVYVYAPGTGQSPQSHHQHSGEEQLLQEPPQQQQSHHQHLQQRQPQQQEPQHQASQQQQQPQQQPQQQQPQQQQPQQQQPHHQAPHHYHQQQQQQQYRVSTYPPPSLPPTLAPQQQQQQLEQGKEQRKQQPEPQKHSQQHSSTGWGTNGRRSDGGFSSSCGDDSCPSMQQVPSGRPPLSEPRRMDKGAAQEGNSRVEDSPRQSSQNAGRIKRPREDAIPYHHPHLHPQHLDAPPSAPAFTPAVGPGALPGSHVDGPVEPPASVQAKGPGTVNVNAGPVTLGTSSNVYQDVRMRFAPDGVAGCGGDGGGQHMGGMIHWHKPWPGATVDNIYQYHVPIRVAGYPIPMQSVPMQYTMPTTPPPCVPLRGGGAPSGVPPFLSQPALLPFPKQPQGQTQPQAAVPLQGVEDSIAITLSSMKGGSVQQAPIDVGKHHHHHEQQSELESRETHFSKGPSQSSGRSMTSAPNS